MKRTMHPSDEAVCSKTAVKLSEYAFYMSTEWSLSVTSFGISCIALSENNPIRICCLHDLYQVRNIFIFRITVEYQCACEPTEWGAQLTLNQSELAVAPLEVRWGEANFTNACFLLKKSLNQPKKTVTTNCICLHSLSTHASWQC